jgi:hypothetical protein
MSAERVRTSGTSVVDIGKVDVLYLFVRSLQWRKRSNGDAGWELLCALSSSDPDTRMAAEGLLRYARE